MSLFSYSFLPVRETLAENLATGGGGIYFLIRDVRKYTARMSIRLLEMDIRLTFQLNKFTAA